MSSYGRAASVVGTGFLARAAATAVTTVGGVFATVFAVRGLGSEGYGAVAFGLAITTLAAVAARVGLGGAVTREIAAAHAETTEPGGVALVVGAAWRVVIPTAALAGTVAGMASALAPLDTAVSGRAALGLGLAIVVLGTNVAALSTFVARGVGRMRSAEAPQVAIVLVQVIGFGWIALRGGSAASVAGAGLVLLLAGVVGVVSGAATVRAAVGPLHGGLHAGGVQLLRRAAPFALAGVATQVIAQADVIVLGVVRGAGEVGSYDPLLRVADRSLLLAPALFLAGFIPAATGQLARGEHEEFGRLYAQTGTLAFVLGVAPLTLLAAFPREVVQALFPAVAADTSVLAILTVGYAVHLAFGLNTGALIASGDRRGIARAYGVAFAAALVLVVALVPPLGAAGAALATAGSYLVMNVAVTMSAHRATGAHPFDRRHVVVVASSPVAVGGGVVAASIIGPTSLLLALGISTAVWGMWVVALGIAGAISVHDLRAFSPGSAP